MPRRPAPTMKYGVLIPPPRRRLDDLVIFRSNLELMIERADREEIAMAYQEVMKEMDRCMARKRKEQVVDC